MRDRNLSFTAGKKPALGGGVGSAGGVGEWKMSAAMVACLYAREFPAQALLRLRPELQRKAVAVMDGEPPRSLCVRRMKRLRDGRAAGDDASADGGAGEPGAFCGAPRRKNNRHGMLCWNVLDDFRRAWKSCASNVRIGICSGSQWHRKAAGSGTEQLSTNCCDRRQAIGICDFGCSFLQLSCGAVLGEVASGNKSDCELEKNERRWHRSPWTLSSHARPVGDVFVVGDSHAGRFGRIAADRTGGATWARGKAAAPIGMREHPHLLKPLDTVVRIERRDRV